ncbi:hypothetical protein LLY42_25270 [Pseudomonas frederiksbergensis]|nr:hypothetical protein LLY42_25270 [Pseudomonas frederiksbergensis]
MGESPSPERQGEPRESKLSQVIEKRKHLAVDFNWHEAAIDFITGLIAGSRHLSIKRDALHHLVDDIFYPWGQLR